MLQSLGGPLVLAVIQAEKAPIYEGSPVAAVTASTASFRLIVPIARTRAASTSSPETASWRPGPITTVISPRAASRP